MLYRNSTKPWLSSDEPELKGAKNRAQTQTQAQESTWEPQTSHHRSMTTTQTNWLVNTVMEVQISDREATGKPMILN